MDTKIFKLLKINGVEQKVITTSYSQIETYLSCPHRWFLDYLLGQRSEITQEALSLGTSVHETLEEYFTGIQSGKTFTVAEAQDMLAFNMEVNNIPYASEANKVEAEQQHNDMMEGLVDGTSELSKFMADKEVVACEKEFKLCIDLPFDIVYAGEKYNKIYIIGSIDFLVKDQDGGLHVVDFKSGKRTFEAKKLRENLQLPIYSLVVKQIYGRLPVSTQYYFTRLDTFQSVMPLAMNEEECHHIYYKNGKIKQEQRTVEQVYGKLVDIFEGQYRAKAKYKAYPTALCSWCTHSPLYGDNTPCAYAQKYIRKDIPIPKKTKRIVKA